MSSGYVAFAAVYVADVRAGTGAAFLLLYALYMSRGSSVAAVSAVHGRVTSFVAARGSNTETVGLQVALLEPKDDSA